MADLPMYVWALLLVAVLGIPAVTGVVLTARR
jgi:ABC-type phosphate/phosphonate transport system permease subunit